MRCTLAHLAAIVLMANALACHATAAGLPAGDIVVAAKISSTDSGLIEINPATGVRTILSDNTHGTGMPFTLAVGVQVMSNGDLLVADGGAPDQLVYPDDDLTPPPPGSPARLYIVDPTTGNRTVISQDAFTSQIAPYPSYPQIGSGPAFYSVGEARQVGNQIVAIAGDFPGGQLMSVNPANGNRAILSGGNVGSGTQLVSPGGFVTSGNTAFEPGQQGLFRIDLTTGNRAIIAGPTVGSGAPFVQGSDVASYDGHLYVVGAGQQSNPASYGVIRIDPITGDRTVVTNGTVGGGPLGTEALGAMAIESGGTFLITADAADINGLLTVDPITGNRALLSDATHGSGPSFLAMYGVTVVPLVGDANGDGITNSQDLATISSQWNQSGYFLAGDLNGDGIVNAQDLAMVSSNWLGTSLAHSTVSSGGSAAVPEPSSLLLITLGGLIWLAQYRRNVRCTRSLFTALVVMVPITNATAAGLPAGDIVVSAAISSTDSGLMEINPATGDRRIISDNTHGTGMPFSYPLGVSFLPNGDLLVADGGALDQPIQIETNVSSPPPGSPARLYIVDPTTGNRTVISQDAFTSQMAPYPTYPQVGSGPAMGAAVSATQVGNRILVNTAINDVPPIETLMSVDPATGNRSVISGPGVGTGPLIVWPGNMLVSGNTAFVASVFEGLFTVDLTTGNRANISGPGSGTGPVIGAAADVEPYDGQLYVFGAGNMNDSHSYGVFRIDPATGDRTLISSSTVGGVSLAAGATMGMAIESGGTILLDGWNGLLSLNPLTGNGAIFSDATHGSGASVSAIHDVAVMPLVGDANGDGITNSQDLATISSQWNQSGYFLAGDLNGDGIVNAQDLALVSSNWLGTSLAHGSPMGNASAAVPEPSSLVLATICGLALVTMRRKARTA